MGGDSDDFVKGFLKALANKKVLQKLEDSMFNAVHLDLKTLNDTSKSVELEL